MNDVIFIHIPKTGGTTVWNVLKIEKFRNAQADSVSPRVSGRYSFGHGRLKDLLTLNLAATEYVDRAYKFAFVRNPYDQVISHWAFCAQTKKWGMRPDTPLLWYLENVASRVVHHGPQSGFIDGPVKLDFLGHFENFENDLRHVAMEIGDGEIEIPHLNKSKRPDYREAYDWRSKKFVEDFYARDFDELGYEREDW